MTEDRKPSLSVVVITRNEERSLAMTLEPVRFADEIVIVDDESTDTTREIAAQFTDRVLVRRLERFGRQKQFAIEQARSDWILVLDADEYVPVNLAEEIRSLVVANDQSVDGYYLRRLTWLFGQPIRHSGWFKCNQLRLFRRGRARFLDRRVHEYAVLDDAKRYAHMHHYLEHNTYADWDDYHAKMERYTELAARDWYDTGRRVGLIRFPYYFVLRPLSVLFRKLVLQRGFLDGRAGWVIAWMSARGDVMTSACLRRYQRQAVC